jgi:hypothetical protein
MLCSWQNRENTNDTLKIARPTRDRKPVMPVHGDPALGKDLVDFDGNTSN